MFHQRSTVEVAMQRVGYQDWRTPFDVPDLKRPRRRPEDLDGDGRSAAVMVLVYLKRKRLHIVLTRRREDLAHHPGQVSLPGGARDPCESLTETAVRETVEEIGVVRSKVQVLGSLNPVYIPPSDFTVVPFVAWYEGAPVFTPSEVEVEELLEVDLQDLIRPETLKTGEVLLDPIPGGTRRQVVPYYQVGPHHVWGATAMMLSEFVDRLSNQ